MSLASEHAKGKNVNVDVESTAPVLVTLVRHPETVANISHALQGSTDSPLTVNGQQQAARLADAIRRACKAEQSSSAKRQDALSCSPLTRGGRPPTHIWTSPAGRTQTLARAIEEASQLAASSPPKVVVREGLLERCFGPREGSIYAQRGSSKELRFIIDSSERPTTPAESKDAFSLRVRAEVNHLVEFLRRHDHANGVDPPVHVVIVTHGLWIGSFLRLVLHPDFTQPFAQNTGLFTLSYTNTESSFLGGRSFKVVTQNDTTHLIGLKRQRGGIGSSASDARQQTLKQLWSSASKKAKTDDGHFSTPSTSSPASRA